MLPSIEISASHVKQFIPAKKSYVVLPMPSSGSFLPFGMGSRLRVEANLGDKGHYNTCWISRYCWSKIKLLDCDNNDQIVLILD